MVIIKKREERAINLTEKNGPPFYQKKLCGFIGDFMGKIKKKSIPLHLSNS